VVKELTAARIRQKIDTARYLLVPLFIRELVVGGWVGVLLIGPLLTGPWLIRLPGFVPLSWVRLPKVSLVFETPYCPSADVPQASIQKIANVNLMSLACIRTITVDQDAQK
jgi:hypothetical protein